MIRIKKLVTGILAFGTALLCSCQSTNSTSNPVNDEEIIAATGFDIMAPMDCIVVEASWLDESGYQVAVGDRTFEDAGSMQYMQMSIKDFMRDKPYGLKAPGIEMGARIWFYSTFRPVFQAPGDLRLETSGFNTTEGGPGSLIFNLVPGSASIFVRTTVTPEAAPAMFFTMECMAGGFSVMMKNVQ